MVGRKNGITMRYSELFRNESETVRGSTAGVGKDGDRVSTGRRIRSFDDAKRRPSGGPGCPDRALGTVRICRGIRHPSLAIGACSPHEHYRRSVVGDLDVGHVDAVVFHEVGETNRGKARRRRRVGVAFTLFERNPGDSIDFSCGHDFER